MAGNGTAPTRTLRSFSRGGVAFLGAVRLADRVLAFPRSGHSADHVRQALADGLTGLDGSRLALRASLPPETDLPADPAETEHFSGRKILLAIRAGETAAAAADWLAYHARGHGAEAALIFDRSPPGETGFASELEAMRPDLPVMVVTADTGLGQPDGPDMRDPATAPAAPKRPGARTDPWFAPIRDQGLYELLRHRFLSGARAIALLDIADLLLPGEDGQTLFDAASRSPEGFVPLRGIETYPWRLRQGAPAPHSDHIASRRGERRRLLSWAATPSALPDGAVWRPGQPLGAIAAEVAPASFIRAMGVVYPGAAVNAIVRKSDLREQDGLIRLMCGAFAADPIRLPAPATIPPRPADGRVTLVTAMKNEGPFVLDWVAHNRVIGVSDILAYTNDCEDGTDRLLDRLADAGVTRRDNPYARTGQVPQHAAFRAAEDETLVQEADWLLTLDVDEYLNIHAGEGGLSDLLAAVPQAHAISVPWRLFGNADVHAFEDQPVAAQFTRAAPEFAPRPLQAWAFKTLYRNAGLFRRLGVHRPKGLNAGLRDSLCWVDATGTPLPPVVWDKAWRASKAQWGYTLAAINHYAVRSAESFLVKRERGKVNRTTRDQGLGYWFRMNHNALEDRSILRLSERVAAEKASLLSLPGVREAHEGAVAWHRARIAALRTLPEYAAIHEQITSPRMERLSRMATYFGANVHLAGPGVIPDEVVARDPSVPFFWSVDLKRSPA